AANCLAACLLIEESLGRKRSFKNAPRTIDIDILFYNKAKMNQELLTIPHPALHLRRFVLVPLNELSPNFKHPVLQKSIHQLLLQCKDELNVNKI
ncbi:MAG TPA: 2-amino-4-hydroxy-6-hydroxymethyldihydropteridine diphosphokinase, partial [Ferruginibacter sp.]|nr:2-amino-4-hydroxy-6-hydroxymethyldihydropteridine diphosphokinase [Ferruginibacter sp.]